MTKNKKTTQDETPLEDTTTPLAEEVPEKSEETTPEDKAEEYLNDLKRLQADFENYKKRQAEAEKTLKGYLTEKLILDIVPVLDNFQQANAHIPESEKTVPWVVGVQYIEKQLETVLTENGVRILEPSIGEVFDPNKHEAIESVMGEDQKPNTIAAVKQRGYSIGDRIIRASKVALYTLPEKNEEADEKGGENS